MNIILGALIGFGGLILYEQYEKQKTANAQKTSPAGTIPTQSAPVGTFLQPPNLAQQPMLYGSSSPSNVNGLPQFSAAQYPTLIDTSAVPIWDGKQWNCPGGEVAYYDPQAGVVYCLLPGTVPGGTNPPDTQSSVQSESFLTALEDALP